MTNPQKKVLIFNARNLIGLNRRSNFDYCLAIENNLYIVCLTEAWLTNGIPDESLFLNEYTVLRNDRNTENHKSKFGGVLIAIESMPHQRIFLET